MRNAGLRQAIGAFALFGLAEWAAWLAILVFAFGRGGAAEAALVAVLQLVPAAIVAPFAASLGDRFTRRSVLRMGYVVQASATGVTAFALAIDAPVAVIYGVAVVTTASFTITRPTHASLLPGLAPTPAALTAANAASGTVQNGGALVGPALTGLLLAFGGPTLPFILAFIVLTVAAGLSMTLPSAALPAHRTAASASSRLGELAGGFRVIGRLPGPRAVVVLLAAGHAVWGALDVLIVVLALGLLQMGEGGVGWLNSAVGLGGVLGAGVAVGLAGRARLAMPLSAGLVVWTLPLAVIGLLPGVAVAVLLLVLGGTGRGLMDVAGRTLLQRSTPDDALARVFGVLEGLQLATLAVGALVVPAVVATVGDRGALILAGVVAPLVVVAMRRGLGAADARGFDFQQELRLLRDTPIFAPLPPPALEAVAAQLVRSERRATQSIIEQGEQGDRFYIVASGEVDVFVDGRLQRTLPAGASFGEIALLRDIPRTASVQAKTDVVLYQLERDAFLSAVTGHALSREAADSLAQSRLEGSG